jgi:hypothetical protein
MRNVKDETLGSKQVEILQDIFIFLLLNASIPQQTVRRVVKVDLSRVTRIGKLIKDRT